LKDPASIFNDVIGPVMIGPSSSHTAASVRIGNLVRQMTGGRPRRVVFEFAAGSSIAETYHSQGADFGLAGGILGLDTADPRIVAALELAKHAGIEIEFKIANFETGHPNVFKVTAVDENGKQIEAEFISCGGGMIEIRQIAGIPVSINGGFYETLLLFGGCTPDIVYACRDYIKANGSSHDDLIISGNDKSEYLIDCRGQEEMPAEFLRQIEKNFPVKDVIALSPVLPVKSQKNYPGLFNTASEILEMAEHGQLSLADIAIRYETRRSGLNETEVFGKMAEIVAVLKKTIKDAASAQQEYPDRILGRQARLLPETGVVTGGVLHSVIRHITLLMEAKSSMRTIVAAPTAGSCGAVPGTLIGAAEALDLPEDAVVKAMLAAGMVGVLIAEHSTFSGEMGGCQAECGSASGMAAAGMVQLLGGTAEQALDAASMALQNVFGLACDPVAGRVEVPCLGKNIMAGSNALAMAELALAGFDKVIPLDETIGAMYKAGLSLPAELRCTGKGGLSLTPTSMRIQQKLEG
jgi:L-serine dehydratase